MEETERFDTVVVGAGQAGLAAAHHLAKRGGEFVILDFEVTVLDDQTPVAGDDAAEVAWVPLPDVIDLALVDGLAEFLHEHGILAVFT